MSDGLRIICVTRGGELPARIRDVLNPRDAEVVFEPNLDRVLERFERDQYDVLVISSAAFHAGRIDGVELIEVITAKSPQTQTLFVAAEHELRMAMSALKAGSYHYARLPVSDEELRLLIETAVQARPKYGPNLLLRKTRGRARFQQLLGNAPCMLKLYAQIKQAAATDIPVLITGETGTGKDLAAQAIHKSSPRKKGPFIPVNLGAVPRELVASELFGHEKGSFTGAAEGRHGIFERGNGGTVFLDEIGSIGEKVQISLLRLIEQKRFHRLGGREWISTDTRIIAASNEDLGAAVEKGRFRQDLFFRLDVFHLIMPPLRERQGDIPLLAEAFLKRYATAFEKELAGIAPECINLLQNYDWPGNVRELKNVIQRAVLVSTGKEVRPEHLPPRLLTEPAGRPSVSFSVGTPLAEVEREMIAQTLAFAGNNRSRAASILGISRRALYNKLRRFGLE